MFKLRSLSSWIGILFLLLFLFSIWYFLFRSQRSDGQVLLPTTACSKNIVSQKNKVDDWLLIYYSQGCQAVAGDVPRTLASWLRRDDPLIAEEFSLPKLPKNSAILLSPQYTWSTFASTFSAPAIKTLGSTSPSARLYLDSALIDLALRREFLLLRKENTLRKEIALSLALSLEANSYSSRQSTISLTPQETLGLLRRCQNSACLAPLRSEQ